MPPIPKQRTSLNNRLHVGITVTYGDSTVPIGQEDQPIVGLDKVKSNSDQFGSAVICLGVEVARPLAPSSPGGIKHR